MLADAAWTQPVDVAPVAAMTRFVAAPSGHLGWIEGRRTFARAGLGGKVRRTQLERAWRVAGFDAKGRALTVTTVTSRRPCRGKRSYRVYAEVRRDGARAQRLVVATGSTTGPMRAQWNSGEGDASGHAVAIDDDGAAVVAYRRGSRMLARVRLRKGFLRAQDLGATPQGGGPGTAVAIDVTGTATVAWTDRCACGEAGMTPAPNPLRVARSNVAGRFTEPAQVLDTGEDVVRLPEVAAGRGVSVVAWGTENGDGATFAAVAPERSRFGPVNAIGTDGGALAVDGFVPTLVSPTQAWRWQAGTWSAEAVGASGFARAAVRDRDDRLALVTQDGERLRVSYRSA